MRGTTEKEKRHQMPIRLHDCTKHAVERFMERTGIPSSARAETVLTIMLESAVEVRHPLADRETAAKFVTPYSEKSRYALADFGGTRWVLVMEAGRLLTVYQAEHQWRWAPVFRKDRN